MERITDTTRALCPPSNGLTPCTPHSSRLREAPAGALGSWRYQDRQGDDACQPPGSERSQDEISYRQADKAFHALLSAGGEKGRQPSLQETMTTDDPWILSLMVNNLMQNSSDHKIKSLCKQIDISSKMASLQLDRRVHQYQDQLQKSIDQADKARKAGIFSALFDWVIAAVETVVGVLKIAEGILTGDPLSVTDGVAYLGAGVSGMVKAGAETAELCGADKTQCDKIISESGKAQNGFEGIALALDICKIGAGIREARVVEKAVQEVLEKGVGTGLTEALSEGSEEGLKNMLENIAKASSENVADKFGASLEREMVSLEEMSTEASQYMERANELQVKKLGKSLSQKGVRELTKQALTKVADKLPGLTEEEMHKRILKQIRIALVKTIINDTMNQSLQIARTVIGGANKTTQGISKLQQAKLQRQINSLASSMNFSSFMVDWVNMRVKRVEKNLGEAYKVKSDAHSIASEIIDNYATALSRATGLKA